MRALLVTDPGQAALADLPEPTPGPGEVLVAVHAAGVNPVDLMVRDGAVHAAGMASPGQPIGTGWDFAGQVLAVGPGLDGPGRDGLDGLAVGDRVAGLLTAMAAPTGAHRERIVARREDLARIPDRLTDAQAATLPLNGLTAVQALNAIGDLSGRSLLVTGAAGGVGAQLIAELHRRGWAADALARESDADAVAPYGVRLVTQLAAAAYEVVIDAAAMRGPALAAVLDGGDYVDLIGMAPLASERGITVHPVLVVADGELLGDLLGQAARGERPVRIAGRAGLDAWESAFAAVAPPGRRGHWLLEPASRPAPGEHPEG